MKFSYNWVSSFFYNFPDADGLCELLTMAGLEVDGINPASFDFSGLVVAKILDVYSHPNSDKLKICSIDDSEAVNSVVCGAPNTFVGTKVIYARPGAIIDGKEIKTVSIKGVKSQGMLIGAEELGLFDDCCGLLELHDGFELGVDFKESSLLPDSIIDVDLTPNRSDCLSIRGLVREISTIIDKPAIETNFRSCSATFSSKLKVELSAPDACPIYIGLPIENLDINAPTPFWIAERLRRSGIRTINAIVDVTNYVMIELGQPMHAFDYQKLVAPIDIGYSKSKRKLKLLDGRVVELEDDVLLISDKKGPLALAGIMGGEESAISSQTESIFLEAAYFDPIAISGRARRYGLATDASSRFERGVDFQIQDRAIERAAELIIDICGGSRGILTKEVNLDFIPTLKKVTLRSEKLNQQLAMELEYEEVERILSSLGFNPQMVQEAWSCVIPSWRFDLSIEQDLVEEIARIVGYDKIPTTSVSKSIGISDVSDSGIDENSLKYYLVDHGLQEVITYSFISNDLQKKFLELKEHAVKLINPISSDMNEMRCSLVPGLIETAVYNINRQQSSIRIFETGQCFEKENGGITQIDRLGILLMNDVSKVSWCEDRKIDFFDLKGILEGISSMNRGEKLKFQPMDSQWFSIGQCAQIKKLDGRAIGVMGSLHPRLVREFNFPNEVFLADIQLQPLLFGEVPSFEPISKYPDVTRDLSIVIDEQILWDEVRDVIKNISDPRIVEICLFDIFRGPGINPDQKSLSFSVRLRGLGGTLEENEIKQLVDLIVERLGEILNACLRG